MRIIVFLFLACLVSACGTKANGDRDALTSVQIVDRNGFKETISSLDRLKQFEKTDFFAPQPYEKVMRMYGRNAQGKTLSKLTTYHENGEVWKYLEVVNGRASGFYREWYDNGVLRLDVCVMEGLGDLSEEAQQGWIFDGVCHAYDEQGQVSAEIHYDKGKLQGKAFYYHPNGKVAKIIPYENGLIDGELIYYDFKGVVCGKIPFKKGNEHGIASFKGDQKQPPCSERYVDGKLIEGTYHDFSGKLTSEIKNGNGTRPFYQEGVLVESREFQDGVSQGEVRRYDPLGRLLSLYHEKEGMKHGPEWIYYVTSEKGEPQPKLYIEWYEDSIHGICRSWYPTGVLESEREVIDNKKHGLSTAWYKDGALMLIEEYQGDKLYKGSYHKRGETSPVSTVSHGEGVVTLYDGEGLFLKRVTYEKGKPLEEL